MNTIRKTLLSLALCACALPTFAQQSYPTPEAAAEALVDALGTTKADAAKLATVLGNDWREYVPEDVDRKDVDAFLARYAESHGTTPGRDGRMMITAGTGALWTLPIPLSRDDKGWRFDLAAAKDDIRDRRIGSNELDVQQVLRAYHDAQLDYAEFDRDGDGTLEYAQKLVSTDGKHDGLYWADDDSGQISPLGPRFGDDKPKGEYYGYRYRQFDAQGPSAPGGAKSFKIGDNMSRGFAAIAWPAEYGQTGVMTMMIGYDGQMFERDLGPKTDELARAMATYDPDSAWKEVPDGTTTASTTP
ncbi:DUF2950 domain-containing protein [Lysobacter sp. A6]|uniref:DUF2950 domain-containing protein n=1 Tax=Noviluteimonas lactosilytica TaxID=2888523 RepID=A0ABS8JGN0_9GAMM|nr:DUF2950 domain-containing protein [Lysobacter lactosilyticus]MCC8362717.1 DUF2950 domain-containing protein [Lysobacter lactosilyticus]